MTIDFTQWIVFCNCRCGRAACAMSIATQGSFGFEPTFRKSEPSGLSVAAASRTHCPVHRR